MKTQLDLMSQEENESLCFWYIILKSLCLIAPERWKVPFEFNSKCFAHLSENLRSGIQGFKDLFISMALRGI